MGECCDEWQGIGLARKYDGDRRGPFFLCCFVTHDDVDDHGDSLAY